MKIKDKVIARKIIIKYLNSVETKIYPIDLSDLLNIDYDLCISIIEDLINEEKVKFED